jgi:uncharacterized protein YndB with AHSA1/START domain
MSDSTASNLGEVTYERVFDAPRELVFECMTTPEHLTHFWGPPGVSTPLDKIEIDLRPGGVFNTTMVNDATGEEYPSSGVYTEIDRPSVLAWEEPAFGMTCRTTFTDLGDGRTRTFTHQTNVPEMFRTPESREGMESSFVRFDEYLAKIKG